MFLSGIPNDTIIKVIFFGGLSLIIAGTIYNENNYAEYLNKFHTVQEKASDLAYEVTLDSTTLGLRQGDDLGRFDTDSAAFNKLVIHGKKKNQLNLLLTRAAEMNQNYATVNQNFRFYIQLGLILFVFGMAGWVYTERQQIKFNAKKRRKEMGEIPCQSCGMLLNLDFHPHMNQEYCGTCFNGTEFTEPDLIFAEMKVKIENKMKNQGIRGRVIRKHIRGLKHLNRWSEKLKWK